MKENLREKQSTIWERREATLEEVNPGDTEESLPTPLKEGKCLAEIESGCVVWEGEYNALLSQQGEKWSEQEQAMWEGEHNSLESP
jgi:hypothetical protein